MKRFLAFHGDTKHNKYKRKIICFNPPFVKSVSTKTGNYIVLHLPKNHIYNNIFNRNKNRLQLHAKHEIIYKQRPNETFKQYCWDKGKLELQKQNNCPLHGKYLIPNIIYEAKIISNQSNYKEKIYIGTRQQISNTDLRTTQNHQQHENNTELSKEYWTIKRSHFTPKVT